jgi:curved DNA-binding protein CbpA
LRLHRRLKSLKAHELLAVPPGAELAIVKRAYFAASKEVHPDRYFGKDIGPYRGLLSDIFAQLTRAFEQLKK